MLDYDMNQDRNAPGRISGQLPPMLWAFSLHGRPQKNRPCLQFLRALGFFRTVQPQLAQATATRRIRALAAHTFEQNLGEICFGDQNGLLHC